MQHVTTRSADAAITLGEQLERDRVEMRTALTAFETEIAPANATFHSAPARRMLARARAELTDQRVAEFARRLEAASAPASKPAIATSLATMLAGFTGTGKVEAQAFVRIMAENVAAYTPSVVVLEDACRRLLRSRTFVPSIAEVLAEIEAVAAVATADRQLVARFDATVVLVEQRIVDREREEVEEARMQVEREEASRERRAAAAAAMAEGGW